MFVVEGLDDSRIPLGRIGENEARVIRFNVGYILAEFPNATFSIVNRRPGDSDAYPVSPEYCDMEENYLVWTVMSGDLVNEGTGSCQIIAIQDEAVVKTQIFRTRVDKALDESTEPPEPWESWTEQIIEAAESVNTAYNEWTNMTATAVSIPSTQPASATYANGVLTIYIPRAQGGGPGGDVIDDEAGEGDTDHTWSANKLVEKFAEQPQVDFNNPVFTGSVSMGRKDNTTTGENSTALGSNIEASGQNSHAEGSGTTASGNNSHAEGTNTVASGGAAHAEGLGGVNSGIVSGAVGTYSHSEGWQTRAAGIAAHSEGEWAVASGNYGAHAEGYQTVASGQYGAHSEGTMSTASGMSSHAEGSGTTSAGSSSHAEGPGANAAGGNSHAEGGNTYANGSYSHVEGYGHPTTGLHTYGAFAFADHAEGYQTKADSGGSNKYGAHAEGHTTYSHGNGSHSEGITTEASGNASHAEGMSTVAGGQYSHTEGYNTSTTASSAHAEGIETDATGIGSHSEGRATTASGSSSHAEGYETTASGDYGSHAEGNGTFATGQNAHAEGNETQANGIYSHAEGYQTVADGPASHAEGQMTTASDVPGIPQTVAGKRNIPHAPTIVTVGPTTAVEWVSGVEVLPWSKIFKVTENNTTTYYVPHRYVPARPEPIMDSSGYWWLRYTLPSGVNPVSIPAWSDSAPYAKNDIVKEQANDGVLYFFQARRAIDITYVPLTNTEFYHTVQAGDEVQMYANPVIEIIGNAVSTRNPSNARMLDAFGNEYLAGVLRMNCNPDGSGGQSAIPAPSSATSGSFLMFNGTAWVAQELSTWTGGSY